MSRLLAWLVTRTKMSAFHHWVKIAPLGSVTRFDEGGNGWKQT